MKSYNGKAKDLRWHLPLIAFCAIVFVFLMPLDAFAELLACKPEVPQCVSVLPYPSAPLRCPTNEELLTGGIWSGKANTSSSGCAPSPIVETVECVWGYWPSVNISPTKVIVAWHQHIYYGIKRMNVFFSTS